MNETVTSNSIELSYDNPSAFISLFKELSAELQDDISNNMSFRG